MRGTIHMGIRRLLESKNGNRRWQERYPWIQEIRFRVGYGTFRKAKVLDVGPGGLRLILPQRLESGVHLQVLYKTVDGRHQHWVEAEVRWCREYEDRFLVGVEVEHCSAVDQRPFEQLLADVVRLSA
jgi:hypothetical protein